MTYTANEQFAEAAGKGSAKRCWPRTIQPKTFASGSGTLAVLTPVQYNKATDMWVVWSGLSGSEKTTITSTATGGNYTLTVNGETTGNIAYNASNATILAALQALGNIDQGDVTVSGGALPGTPAVLTWAGQFVGTAPTVSITDSTTGGTTTIAETVAGVSGGGKIRAFVWPDPIVLSGSGEVIGHVVMEGKIHYDDIVLPAGESRGTMQAALREGPRALGLMIQGLDGVR